MNEPPVSDTVLGAAARLLARRVGLRLDPAMRGRLTRCVSEEARSRHLDVGRYVALLGGDAALLQSLLDRVTVQETSFFRDAGQFAALATLLPQLPAPVRIWSAGCANGQEPYSLAMVLDEAQVPDWGVIATDVSTRAVARTRRGRYTSRELAGVDQVRRDRHFLRVGGEWEVVSRLRERVEVRHHNLAADPPPFDPGACDIVFCRNVLIYFHPAEVAALLERLTRWMRPGTWLFAGYAESLWQVTDRFQLVRIEDTFAYRLREEGAPAASFVRGASTTHTRSRRRSDASPPRPASPTRRPPPADRSEPAPKSTPVPSESGVVELLREGEAAMSAADYTGAVTAFRRAAYLDADQPVAHLHLALALEAVGDAAAARRAYAAARSAIQRGDTAEVEALLEGYHIAELHRLLDTKLGTGVN